MIALGIAAVVHVLIGYLFITGLAVNAIKIALNKIEAVNVKEEAPPPDEPPPPPPKEMEIPPYVPPPEVSIQSESAPTITTQTTISQPEPPRYVAPAPPAPPAPPSVAPTAATAKGRGNVFSDDDFPDASRRAEEAGVTRVSYTIDETGKVSECTVTQSSGFARLDDATCKIIMRRFRFNPATRDGRPVAERKTQPVRWQLKN